MGIHFALGFFTMLIEAAVVAHVPGTEREELLWRGGALEAAPRGFNVADHAALAAILAALVAFDGLDRSLAHLGRAVPSQRAADMVDGGRVRGKGARPTAAPKPQRARAHGGA